MRSTHVAMASVCAHTDLDCILMQVLYSKDTDQTASQHAASVPLQVRPVAIAV
jgi:hypothetical protein